MLLDINQLWPQDILAVQDTVQVQGSTEILSLREGNRTMFPEPGVAHVPKHSDQPTG